MASGRCVLFQKIPGAPIEVFDFRREDDDVVSTLTDLESAWLDRAVARNHVFIAQIVFDLGPLALIQIKEPAA